MIAPITNFGLYFGYENKNLNAYNLSNAAFEAFDSSKHSVEISPGEVTGRCFPRKQKESGWRLRTRLV